MQAMRRTIVVVCSLGAEGSADRGDSGAAVSL
jgi:hypothetical protein